MPYYFLLIAVLFLLPAAALAQTDDTVVLSEVVVTPKNFTEKERKSSTSGFVIDKEAIKNSGAANLSELLIEQGFAVEATPTDHGENTTLIRGFQTEHLMTEANGKLLILIDGRRSGVASTRQISLNNVERVEILRGPEMFKYSMGSPGGVINVITKRGGPEQFSGSARVGYGSYDAWKAGMDINGLVNNFDYYLGYEYNTVRSDYKDGNGNRVQNSKTDGTNSVNFNVGYTLNKKHHIGVDGYFYNVDKAHRPSYVDEEGETRESSYTDRDTHLLYLNYEGATQNGRLSWQANVGQGKDTYETYEFGSKYPKGQEAETKRAQGSLTYNGALLEITGGLDYIKYELENSSTARGTYLKSGGLDPLYSGIGYPMHPTSSTSIFGSYMVSTLKLMGGSLNISGGLRYEYATAKDLSVGDEYYNKVAYFKSRGITSRDQLPTERTFDHLSPTFGITYLPLDWLKLRANYTEGWRAPSGRQLFASSFYEDYGAPGDPRLEPELTDAYEAGFDIACTHLIFSGTYFYYEIENNVYIYPGVTADGTSTSGRVILNADERIQSGFEFQLSANVAGLFGYKKFELRPYFNITHMIRKEEVLVEDGPGLLGTWWPITRMPDTTMSYGILFNHFNSKFSANLNFSYYGEQYGGRANVGDGPLVGFGEFTVANLSLRKQLFDFGNKGNVELKGNINNIFDETYSYLGRVPEDSYAYPGRNFFVTLVYNF